MRGCVALAAMQRSDETSRVRKRSIVGAVLWCVWFSVALFVSEVFQSCRTFHHRSLMFCSSMQYSALFFLKCKSCTFCFISVIDCEFHAL